MKKLAGYGATAVVGILLVGALAAAQQSGTSAPRTKWEYKVIDMNQVRDDVTDKTPGGFLNPVDTYTYNNSKIEAFLGRMDEEGWELVTIRIEPGAVSGGGSVNVTGGGSEPLADKLFFRRAK